MLAAASGVAVTARRCVLGGRRACDRFRSAVPSRSFIGAHHAPVSRRFRPGLGRGRTVAVAPTERELLSQDLS